jgi:YegS/Rv2252/BmrU family lipid kinase
MPAPVCLIVNPAAGGGKAGRLAPAVEVELRRLGLTVRREDTTHLDHARELGLEVARAGETVVALSGDGMLGVLADALRSVPGATLGVLPGGRGNDFARVLGIPLDAVPACEVLAHGRVRALDLGEAGTETFVSIASCGFDSTANRIANETRFVRGNLVYTYGGLRALLSWKPARFELTLDGAPRTLMGINVAIANSSTYGGGMRLAPDARLDDGLFDVVLIGEASRLVFLRSLRRVFAGTHVALPMVEVVRCREVEVRADRPFTMYADGDPIVDLPVTVRCLPGAVNVLVPQ